MPASLSALQSRRSLLQAAALAQAIPGEAYQVSPWAGPVNDFTLVDTAGKSWGVKDIRGRAMDPADVAKVMRQETADWIKNTADPVVATVNKALFGGWEGNWMACNTAHDVVLPNAKGTQPGFFMYLMGENAARRSDSYAPDDFKYQIMVKEIKA